MHESVLKIANESLDAVNENLGDIYSEQLVFVLVSTKIC